jgi:hypothetical protein
MSHITKSKLSTNNSTVDWNDPHLEALLRKTESWKLDNRSAFTAEEVQLHVGWGASATRKAMLVWEVERVMVLETHFRMPQGEHVRVDRIYADGIRTMWGVVADEREGFREEDRENGVYVHWVHMG